jgi:hypothetical protein
MTLHAPHGRNEVIESSPRAPDLRAGFVVELRAAGSHSLAPSSTSFARAEAELSAEATGQQVAMALPPIAIPCCQGLLVADDHDSIIYKIRRRGLLKRCFHFIWTFIMCSKSRAGSTRPLPWTPSRKALR